MLYLLNAKRRQIRKRISQQRLEYKTKLTDFIDRVITKDEMSVYQFNCWNKTATEAVEESLWFCTKKGDDYLEKAHLLESGTLAGGNLRNLN